MAKKNVPGEVFDLLEKLKINFETKRAVHQALKEQEDRLNKEFNSLLSIQDNDEREAVRLRLEVVENILTLRCPRCKNAFIDYADCAALECSNCNAAFCALCLKDCGDNAHSHVLTCPDNKHRSKFYIDKSDWQEHHRKRRQEAVSEVVRGLGPGKIREIFLNKINKELDDLRIVVNSGESTTVERIRYLAKISDRTCPMCLKIFNTKSWFAFQLHVGSHFSN